MFVKRLAIAALACATLLLAAPASAQDKVKVVTTFSILADLVKNVGGDRVEITSLVPVNGDAHVYAPSPADAKKLADAKVVFTNGLGFEGWIPRLVKSSATKAAVVVATKGIKPRKSEEKGHGHGHSHDADADPHAWQSVANAKVYVANIRDALIAADPAGKGAYDNNATAYTNKLDQLEADVKSEVARIPADRRRIITTHDAFGYFKAAYGVDFVAPQGVSTEMRGLGQGRRQDHHPDQKTENSGRVPGECQRSAAPGAHCRRDRRQGGRHALFGCPDRRKGQGPHLHRHDEAQYKDAQRRPDELTPCL